MNQPKPRDIDKLKPDRLVKISVLKPSGHESEIVSIITNIRLPEMRLTKYGKISASRYESITKIAQKIE